MARSIDERIVRMSLENKDFEEKASRTTTIFGKMLDSFKKVGSINLDKPAKDIGKLNQESEKGSIAKLADQATGAAKQMGMLGIAGVTALVNITNRAVDAGIQMAKSFTTKPIMDGFGEYELKMKSIQTILSNTQGKNSLKDVTGVLDELNTYADKTIYNFAEMTSNIGTFTAAGVGLEDSATAIKGIANLAAASGSNSQQASTAMYQLSQALATGSVKLQDWNSVVNAGMGGKLFQNALIKTADNMGIANSASENFRDSLQEGWLTTDVLLATLQEFSEDQSMLDAATKVRTFTQLVDTAGEALGSGWAQTWEYILGDFDEAGKMWSAANDAISKPIEASAKARNDLVKGVVELGGRKKAIEAISNAFKTFSSIITTAKSAMKDIFPPVTAERIYKIIEAIADFTTKLVPTEKATANLHKVFKALFAIVDIGVTVLKAVGKVMLNLIPKGVGGDITNLVLKLSDMILKFRDVVKGNDTLNGSFKGVGDATNKVYEVFKNFLSFISGAFTSGLNGIRSILDIVSPYIKSMTDELFGFFKSFTSTDILTGGLVGFIILVVKKFSSLGDGVSGIIEKLTDAAENFGENIKFFGKLGETLEAMTANIKANTLLQIGIAIGVMAVSIKLLSTIPMQDLSKGIAALSGTLFAMLTTLKSMSKMNGGVKTAFYAATVLPALALSVVALAGALKIIASMNPEELSRGLVGLVTIFATLATSVIVISKFGGKLKTSAVSLVALATAVVILASAVKILSKIETNDLIKGITGLAAMLGTLAIFLKIVDKTKFKMSSAIALTITTGAILVMVQAIKQIANIKTDDLVKGLTTLGVILLELGLFSRLAGGTKVMSASVGMLIVAQAVKQLIPPIKELGETDTKTLAKGLTALAITLGEVVLAMRLAKGGLVGSTAILITAAAINILVPAISSLGKLTWSEIAKGLVTLAGAFGIIAIASKLIGITGSVALFAFAAAVMGLGVAAALVSVAVLGFMTALNALAAMTDETVDNIVSAVLGLADGLIKVVPKLVKVAILLITEMAKGLAYAAPILFEAALTIVIGLLDAISNNISPFIEKGSDIVVKLMEGIGQEAPRLLETAVKMIIDLVNGLATTIDQNSEPFIQSMIRLMGSILIVMTDGLVVLVETLFGWIPGVEKVTGNLGESAKEGIREHFDLNEVGNIGAGAAEEFVKQVDGKKGSASKAGTDLGSVTKKGIDSTTTGGSGRKFGDDFTTGVNSKQGAASTSGKQLSSTAKSNLESIKTEGSGRSFGGDFVKGVNGQSGNSSRAGKSIAKEGKHGLQSVNTDGPGANFGEGFARGIESKSSRVSGASSWLAGVGKSALEGFLKIFSPSRVMFEDGGHFGEGFAMGIEDKKSRVKTAAVSIADSAKSMIDKTVEMIDKSISDNMDFEPRIKPIVDFKQFKVPEYDKVLRLQAQAEMASLNFANRQNEEQLGSQVTNYNEWNIKSDNPKAVAREVEKIITRRTMS